MTSQFSPIPISKNKKFLPYQLLKMYRLRLDLNQQELAKALGLGSRRMVQYWEADNGLPKADNLKKLVAVFLEMGAFRKGAERQEAELLWASVKEHFEARSDRFEVYPIFDNGWFEDLVSTQPDVTVEADVSKIEKKAAFTVTDAPETSYSDRGLELTSFIGRDKELAALQQLLKSSRLITLTGTGGCGKTRLALKVAEAVTADFSDGVVFVNLANLTDPTLVAPAVAQTLGLSEIPGSALTDTLKAYLKDKKLLLVLDNFEQLLSAVGWLADLLANTRFLKLLVTSRVILNLYGEQHYPLAPLPLPSDDNKDGVALEDNPAVALFVDRARFYRPDFALTSTNSRAVVQICTLLDGLPLAMELAAARIKFLTPQKLLEKLVQHRLKLPGEPAQNMARRHQTLYDTLDWSYSLLTKSTQKLFRRLAVFTQEWTLEEAEKVCSGAGLEEEDIADLVARLFNHSLLTVKSESDEDLHYYMLETIRAYALEKLIESGETESWNKAISHFVQAGDKLRFANFSTARLHYSDGLRAVNYLPEGVERQRSEADLLVKYISVSFAVVDRPQTLPQLDACISKMEGLIAAEALAADKLRLAWLCYWAGYLLYFLEGEFTPEFPYWQKALEVAEELQQSDLLITIKTTIGRTIPIRGVYQQALFYLEESATLLEKSDNWTARINANLSLSIILNGLGRHAESLAVGQTALAEAQQMGNLSRQGYAYVILANSYLQARDWKTTLQYSWEGLILIRQTGELNNLVMAFYIYAIAAAELGHKTEADEILSELIPLLENGNMNIKPIALACAGIAATSQGQYDLALDLTEKAMVVAEKMNNLQGTALAHRTCAKALSKKEGSSLEEIGDHFNKALEGYERTGIEIEIANTFEDIGDFYQNIGDYEAAITYYGKARELFKKFGIVKRVTQLENYLVELGAPVL